MPQLQIMHQTIPVQARPPAGEREEEEAESIRRRRQEHVMQHLLRIQEASDEIVSLSETMKNRHRATLATLDSIDQMAAQQQQFLRHSTQKQSSSTSHPQTPRQKNHREDQPRLHSDGRDQRQEVNTSRVNRRSRQRHRASTETLVGETFPFPLAESTRSELHPRNVRDQPPLASRTQSPVRLSTHNPMEREPNESTIVGPAEHLPEGPVLIQRSQQQQVHPDVVTDPGAPRAQEPQEQHQLPAWPITRSRSRPGITQAAPILQLRSRSKS